MSFDKFSIGEWVSAKMIEVHPNYVGVIMAFRDENTVTVDFGECIKDVRLTNIRKRPDWKP